MKSSGILILALALCTPAAVLLPGACSGGKGVVPLRYVCNDVRYGGFYASDHFPLHVDFEIK